MITRPEIMKLKSYEKVQYLAGNQSEIKEMNKIHDFTTKSNLQSIKILIDRKLIDCQREPPSSLNYSIPFMFLRYLVDKTNGNTRVADFASS